MDGDIEENLTYCDSFSERWRLRIRTNNVIESLNRDIRKHARVVGRFLDGNFDIILVYTRLCHVVGIQ